MTIAKTIHVKRAPRDAFRLFTEEIGKWWPLQEGFSHGGERAKEIFLEGRVGGRFYERFVDGTELEVGRVTVYEPPSVVKFSWRSPSWEGATEVEVRFSADGAGTKLELEHRGWEVGPKAMEAGKRFDGGWVTVLARYAAAA
jgi:uncharacterized protein YndB with AHSA1/START domain